MGEHREASILEETRARFREIVENRRLLDLEVSVLTTSLTPEEAIGAPGRRDFPIAVGRERVIEAEVLGAKGHAFTDSPGDFAGSLEEVLNLELITHRSRAIFVATLNAVLRHLEMVRATVHCRDDDPESCAKEIASVLFQRYGKAQVGLIGLNPAIAERLVDRFGPTHVRITDLNSEEIGSKRFGVEIWDGDDRTEDLIALSDVVLVTGTTIVNGTFDRIWEQIRRRKKDFLLYGVTAAGVSELLGLERICPCGRDV
jgi:uncharacterized protein (DUF4213/DUF364 family)